MSSRSFLQCGRSWSSALAVATLAGCGGSLYLGYGGEADRPPEVSLAVAPDAARRGQTVRLVAAASDDYSIDRVEFYRVDGGVAVQLASDNIPPYQVDAVVPSGATGTQPFYARAIDDAGQARDSAVASVTVLP